MTDTPDPTAHRLTHQRLFRSRPSTRRGPRPVPQLSTSRHAPQASL